MLTDPRLAIAGITRGPLVMVPLFVTLLGILFFFPRFARFWAMLSNNPFRAIATYFSERDRKFF